MNWIEKMIAEQCPNGVKKVKLGDVCEKITDGSHNLPPTVEFSDFRMISSQNIYNTRLDFHGIRYLEKEGYEKENKRTYVEKDNVLLTIVGAIGRCYVVKKEDLPFTCQRSVCVIKLNKDKYNPYFLHECIIGMSSTLERQANGAAQKGLYLKQVAQIEIPLPPLSIQKEIVSVLDKFSELIEKTDEEIALRQKQYEYYREKLLTFEKGEVKKVSSFAELKAGKAISAKELSEIKDNEHQYPCFGGNGIRGYINKKSHTGNYAIIGRQGALCGCVSWATGDFYATEHAVVVTPKKGYDSRFLFYFFTNANLNQYKSQGAQPGLAVSNLNELKYALPSLSRQQEIVATLDKFETLISKLKEERELRQKQYEYYREKLLTF